MQARDVFAKDHAPRQYVFAARDRADETVDRIRSVRSERFKYLRNFYPSRPYLQSVPHELHTGSGAAILLSILQGLA